ncbi:Cms1 protein [Pichia kluyveri]|uniref:Cms1 protein n=1 Tax=Pichia kluyveri TaxID=36015 RepID=A0AAV5R7M3_PICKL|nr:Cms1 protein [Pichia kluyveri]
MTVAEKKNKVEDVEGLDDGLAVDYKLSDDEEGVEIEEEEESPKETTDDTTEDTTIVVGKKRKNKSEESKSQKKQKMEFEKENKKSLSNEKNDIIVEKISSKIREIFPNLSPLELSDYYLKKENVIDTSEYNKEKNLTNLSNFIETFMKELIPSIKEYKRLRNKIKKFETKKKFNKKFNKTVEIPPRKFILILSISAIRSCDVHRATRDLEGGSVKLINKNPIGQDLKMLKTTWSRILNSTVERIDKILEISKNDVERNFEDGLTLKEEEIDTIILDNYIDSKLRSVLDYCETFELIKKIKDKNPNLKVYVY